MLDDGILKLPSIHYCEFCHRPDVGADRCPHAINRKFDCPRNKRENRALADRLRRLGR